MTVENISKAECQADLNEQDQVQVQQGVQKQGQTDEGEVNQGQNEGRLHVREVGVDQQVMKYGGDRASSGLHHEWHGL